MNASTHLLRRHRTLQQLVDALAYERHLRRPFIEELCDELTAHLATYDTILGPILGALPPDVVVRLNQICLRTRAALHALGEAIAISSSAYEPSVARLCELARECMDLDRDRVIPAFEAALDATSLERLGHALYVAELARPAATA